MHGLSVTDIAAIEAVEREAWSDLYASAAPETRETLGIHQRPFEDGALLISRVLDSIQFNRLTGLGLGTPTRAAAVDEAIAAFDAAGVRNWIIHVAEGADSLREHCIRLGLKPHPRTWAKFIRGAERITVPRSDVAIREIGRAEAAAFATTATAAFDMPSFASGLLAGLPGRPRWRCFMAYDRATPVATGTVYVDRGAAWLGIGATLASHRRLGAQTALIAARVNAAIDAGARLLTTETGIPHPGEAGSSFANIQRAGFRLAYPRPNFWRGGE